MGGPATPCSWTTRPTTATGRGPSGSRRGSSSGRDPGPSKASHRRATATWSSRTSARCSPSEQGRGPGRARSLPRLDSAEMADKLPNKLYLRELERLQEQLVQMEESVWDTKARIAVVFEGRDAAGKGGAIKRITEHMNPRITKHI